MKKIVPKRLDEKVYVIWEDNSKINHKVRFKTTKEAQLFIK